tara:strand:- start:373 stop:642 length:270 start_codon:yes stop_codon:yes gene_type:complete
MKTLVAILALLPITASVAQADIRYPNTAGSKYCELRSAGVTKDDALRVAVQEGWDSDYTSPTVTRDDGSTVDLDVLEMTDYIVTMCPQY